MATRTRLVLLDAFDTLITPRLAINVQYAEEATKLGLSVTPSDVKAAFKQTFPAINKQYPLYGLHAGMSAERWWTILIEETMKKAGINPIHLEKSMPTLAPRLLQRFASSEGYRAFDDAKHALEAFKSLGVKTAVLSNADSRILQVLHSLEITPLLTAPPTLNHLSGFSKPDRRIYDYAISQAGVDASEAVMIGDELEADYHGARRAGLRSLLIRRDGEWSEGASRTAEEDLEGVEVVRSLAEAVERVKEWNDRI